MKLLKTHPAMEAISFQDAKFAQEMADVFAPYMGRKTFLKAAEQKELTAELHAITFARFGANVDYICSLDGAHVIPPSMTANNVLNAMFVDYADSEDGLKLIRKAKGSVKGQIDLDKAKLSGVFSMFKPTINIDLNMLVSDGFGGEFTPLEVAAVNLHEIGHFFTLCEMVRHTVTTNQVLAGLDRVIRHQDSREIEIAFEEAGRELGVEKAVIDDLKKSSNRIAAVTVLVTKACQGHRTEYGDPLYDYNSCEMMADQFATRMGVGRELMSALDKVYTMHGVWWRNTRLKWFLSTCCEMLFNLLVSIVPAAYFVALGGTLMIAGLLTGILFILLFLGAASTGGTNLVDTLYETPDQRCLRVRRQLIELSKDPKISHRVAKKILEDCEFLEETAKRYVELESMWGPIGRAIFSSVRRLFKSRDLQRDLESFALNELFLKSLALKHA